MKHKLTKQSKCKIFITRQIPKDGIDLLKNYFHVKVYSKDHVIPNKELYAGAKWADALLCLLTDHIDKKFIEVNRHLKAIANYAVGFDNIHVETATTYGIPVMNTPGVLNEAVAEHALSLICAVARRIPEADVFMREGRYKGWGPMLFLGSDFFNRTLGIVGLGNIGINLAKRASQGLGMKILYTDPRVHTEFEKSYNAKRVSLSHLLKESDYVSLHVPLMPSTHHLISAKELGMMKRTAYLINTARGPIVDEKALVKVLQKKRIAGAALDVFEHEPKLAPGLIKLKNVVLTPHIASATITARRNMSLTAAQGIVDVLHHHKPSHLVNPLVWRRALKRIEL